MVIGDSEMVDKMTAGGKNCATYTMRQDLRGTDVTTNDCVMCLNMLRKFVSVKPPMFLFKTPKFENI